MVPEFLLPALASQTVSRLVLDSSTPDRGVLRLWSTEFLRSGHSVCLRILSLKYRQRYKDLSQSKWFLTIESDSDFSSLTI